jgi:hypothetical protein
VKACGCRDVLRGAGAGARGVRTLIEMPYREAEVVERCWVCAVESRLGCRCCRRPCCEVHVSDHGRCAPCELAQYEKTVVRDKVMPVLGGAIYALSAVAMVGGSATAFAVAAMVAMVGGVSLAERSARRRELPPATTSMTSSRNGVGST